MMLANDWAANACALNFPVYCSYYFTGGTPGNFLVSL